MPALAALVYLLLCMRLIVRIDASAGQTGGNVSLSIEGSGMQLRYDAKLVFGKEGGVIRTEPRYKLDYAVRKDTKAQIRVRRFLLSSIRRILYERRFDRIRVHARLGAGDAAQTAVACGALHAWLCAAILPLGRANACELRVIPDFTSASFCAYLQGIFSCQPGDIMLAVLKAACKKQRKTGKEGFRWKSIPLRV